MSATNVASTMVAMLVNNPLVEQLDLTSLRVLSCGGSPQSPAGVRTTARHGQPMDMPYLGVQYDCCLLAWCLSAAACCLCVQL